MAIDLKKNKDSLLKAYNDVVSDSSDTNWAIFGYEGLTNTLKTVSTGDGGLEEVADEVNSGHIQYAYCRVTDPNTALPKYVLINWQGEGAQDSFKLKCTAHLRDITAFLKTVHVTVNARTETDIDEDDIIKKVAKASGANYSFHKEKAKPMEAPGPVGTDYHRVIPTRDINPKSRDQFWVETEKDEIRRKEEEARRAKAEQERLDQERKEREMREAKERDKRIGEHARQIREQKEAERKANELNKQQEKERWERQQRESFKDEEERGHRSDALRKERQAEAAALVGSNTSSARDFFKQKSVERPDADPRKAPPPPRQEAEVSFCTRTAGTIGATTESTDTVTKVRAASRGASIHSLPPRQDSDEEEEQNWDEPPQEDFSPQQTPHVQSDAQEPVNGDAGGGDHGQCARALYDYQASDDTEISFDPDDIITNIDQIDSGWWQGFAPDGSYGMFPANYVELI
ncbi:hypothetical protein BaRGS_00031257 [Batillaria attramentaria]|uniref:Coactosin-like protein n=1 Tax=Batillaria attramentaria TaxID=370345 RepID=A0ABD0JSE4_9CAEN